MLLFYLGIAKSDIPVGISAAKFEDSRQAKMLLKKLYSDNEGEESITVAVYDAVIDSETNTTVVDKIIKYVDFPFVEFFVIKPKKDYHLGNTRVNVVLPFDQHLRDRTEHFRKIGSKVHAIDDIKMFFIGHEMRLPKGFA